MLLFHTIDISPAAERNATTITQIVISRKAENSVECKICGMQNIRQKIPAADNQGQYL